MNKQEAAQLIDQAISQIQTTRQVHVQLQLALGVLTSPEDSASL